MLHREIFVRSSVSKLSERWRKQAGIGEKPLSCSAFHPRRCTAGCVNTIWMSVNKRNMFRNFTYLMSVLVVFAISAAAQSYLPGEVVDVVDGKTVVVAVPGGRINVELQYIDTPDQGQNLHEVVRNHLRETLVGKTVQYRPMRI